ncbi:MAG: DUF4286 family protein [Muribaculaceae bacterium]|nr:DUF4286 family protein [Muribaculaceae bacterium]
MIILNITFATEASLQEELCSFIKDTFIPAAVNDGFHSLILSRVQPHDAAADDGTVSLALQMRAPSEVEFEEFSSVTAPALLDLMGRRWGARVLFFFTRLDVLHDTNREQ